MKSMTGYGKAVAKGNARELTVELKSVNHRYLDIATKIPRMFIAYEHLIREIIGKNVGRGHVDVYINYSVTEEAEKKISVDFELAKSYVDTANELSAKFKLKNDFDLCTLIKTPDVVKVEEDEENEQLLKELLVQALSEATVKLNEMREAEGARLKKELVFHLSEVERLVKSIKEYAPSVVSEYKAKIEARVKEVLSNVEVDQARLLNEVAFFSDKCNIDEEICRLFSHLEHAKTIINDEGAGRQLDFLIQELNREINTVCSKSNSVNLTNLALQVKNKIEKVREQVQNIQ